MVDAAIQALEQERQGEQVEAAIEFGDVVGSDGHHFDGA